MAVPGAARGAALGGSRRRGLAVPGRAMPRGAGRGGRTWPRGREAAAEQGRGPRRGEEGGAAPGPLLIGREATPRVPARPPGAAAALLPLPRARSGGRASG